MRQNTGVRISLLAILVAASPLFATSYTITEIGSLTPSYGNGYSCTTALNDKGQVTGMSLVNEKNWDYHAFIWDPGTEMKDLGTLNNATGSSGGYAINNHGMVVGYSVDAKSQTRATVWGLAGARDIGTLGGTYSQAMGVNDKGQVVGSSNLSSGYSHHAFVWSEDKGMTDLGTLGGYYSYACDINNSGNVAGYSQASSKSGTHAFFYQDGQKMIDLGTLNGGWDSYAIAVNDKDQVIGSASDAEGYKRSFIWDSISGMRDMGDLGIRLETSAAAINNSGVAVGYSIVNEETWESHAFIYQDGKMTDLNSLVSLPSGWVLNGASAINNNGDILAYANDLDGYSHSYLLTLSSGSAVPEPASAALMTIGLLLASNRRWNKTTTKPRS